MNFKMKDNGFTSDLDFGQLFISGQEEYGFRPYQLLLSSVAGCSGGVLRKVLTKMRIEFDDIEIEANAIRNPEEADRIEKISMHFIIKGSNINESKIEKALILTKKNCSMVQSVIGSIEIVETFEIL